MHLVVVVVGGGGGGGVVVVVSFPCRCTMVPQILQQTEDVHIRGGGGGHDVIRHDKQL